MVRKPDRFSTRMKLPWIAVLGALLLAAHPASAQTRPPLRPVVDGCPVCDLWKIYEGVMLQSRQEIGRLQDGVIYLYYSDRPSVIEPIIRFAYERGELDRALQEDPDLRQRLGGACGHNLALNDPDYRMVLSTSPHGFFVVLTSSNRTTTKLLHQEAQRSVRSSIPVRF